MEAEFSRRLKLALLALLFGTSIAGCTFSLDWYRQMRAKALIEKQNYPAGLEILQKIVASEPDSPGALEAARYGARIAHLNAKNYALAVEFFRHIVLRSPDAGERKNAQKLIAQIEFENLQDFNQAVLEYEKLLRLDNTPEETFRFRLNLAKSQLRMSNIDQAVTELDIVLSQKHSPDEIFEGRILKANTLIAAKRTTEAVTAWQELLKEFPEKSKKENVALNLVVVYEELKEFSKAIEVLQGMREGYAHPDFLDLRIQRLRERMGNQPGAQGLKR
jgi:tetratricopeptide (TPR) repeat protein